MLASNAPYPCIQKALSADDEKAWDALAAMVDEKSLNDDDFNNITDEDISMSFVVATSIFPLHQGAQTIFCNKTAENLICTKTLENPLRIRDPSVTRQ